VKLIVIFRRHRIQRRRDGSTVTPCIGAAPFKIGKSPISRRHRIGQTLAVALQRVSGISQRVGTVRPVRGKVQMRSRPTAMAMLRRLRRRDRYFSIRVSKVSPH
jgi:hypothetical protein